MLRRVLGLTALVALLPVTGVAAQPDRALEDAWVVERLVRPDGTVDRDPGPGLFLFTAGHYSQMMADSSRAELPENPTDAERAAAFEGFHGNTGRYELRGDTLTLRPFVASRPYRMNDFPDHGWTLTYRVTGDTLRLQAPRGLVIILRRVDGAGLKR